MSFTLNVHEQQGHNTRSSPQHTICLMPNIFMPNANSTSINCYSRVPLVHVYALMTLALLLLTVFISLYIVDVYYTHDGDGINLRASLSYHISFFFFLVGFDVSSFLSTPMIAFFAYRYRFVVYRTISQRFI